MAAAEEFVPPAWVTIPAELAVEILAVVAVEMRLVVELHEVYGRAITGTGSERALAVAKAWSERRGVTPLTLITPGGAAQILGRTSRREVTRLLQRRLTRRALRSLWSLAPLLAGAAAAATANRRATRSLGQAVQQRSPGRVVGGWWGQSPTNRLELPGTAPRWAGMFPTE